jgi:phosphotriesterase-related protein
MAKVQTVRGAISPDELGVTLTHEHLLCDLSSYVEEPDEASEKFLVDAPVSMETLALLRTGYLRHCSKDNMRMVDVDISIREAKALIRQGGRSLVEATLIGFGRDPVGLRKISEQTGLNVICASGWYIAPSHPDYIRKKGVDELCAMMVAELTEGIGTDKIKAGVLKCACSYPPYPDEKKLLQAAAAAQKQTGAPLTIHPPLGFVDAKPAQTIEPILDIIAKNDANLGKVYVSHMDNFLFGYKSWDLNLDYHKSLVDNYGVVLNFDNFGKNYYYIFPSVRTDDMKRVEAVAELCKQGYDHKIMLSHDYSQKMNLRTYGGDGYSHVLRHIVPELEFHDVTQQQIKNLLIRNPQRILAY